MSIDKAKAYLQVISRYTNDTCFTGGEVFIYHSEIEELTRYAKKLGLQVSLVTGAGWVKREEDTRRKVKALVDAGLGVMGISWDTYHEEVSSRYQARTLARIAIEEGLEVVIRSAVPVNSDAALVQEAFEGIPVKFEKFRLHRLGRAKALPLEHFEQYKTPPKGACNDILSKMVIYDNDNVYACCGPSYFSEPHSPLMLGNTVEEPLEVILDRALNDPILDVISLLGPYGLYLLLQQSKSQGLYTARESYTDICDLCLDLTNSPQIVSAIREQLKEKEAQVLMTAARLWMEKVG